MRLRNRRNGGLVTVADDAPADNLARWGWEQPEPKKPAKKAAKKG